MGFKLVNIDGRAALIMMFMRTGLFFPESSVEH